MERKMKKGKVIGEKQRKRRKEIKIKKSIRCMKALVT